ncbi:MAG: glutamine amidotransferase [Actinomycetia bacterium]|nr:glutamine amidotransferase [Actinomycetes bacterium]
MSLTICYLYPEMMNIYGDRGNVMALVRRCRWRDIAVDVEGLSLREKVRPGRYDIFFMGGGQDREQVLVCRDLLENKGDVIKREIEDGAAALVICGGYQLFGKYYRPFEGEELPGINVFDAYTIAGKKRMIGNVVAKSALGGRFGTVVGFENHSGKTYLGEESTPLGMVTVGSGNNGEDRTEGAVHLGAIGTYLHGSLLPKNPGLADFLIERGLARRGESTSLRPLDDTLEWRAHREAVARARKTH